MTTVADGAYRTRILGLLGDRNAVVDVHETGQGDGDT